VCVCVRPHKNKIESRAGLGVYVEEGKGGCNVWV